MRSHESEGHAFSTAENTATISYCFAGPAPQSKLPAAVPSEDFAQK
jgi:hypothetical protein